MIAQSVLLALALVSSAASEPPTPPGGRWRLKRIPASSSTASSPQLSSDRLSAGDGSVSVESASIDLRDNGQPTEPGGQWRLGEKKTPTRGKDKDGPCADNSPKAQRKRGEQIREINELLAKMKPDDPRRSVLTDRLGVISCGGQAMSGLEIKAPEQTYPYWSIGEERFETRARAVDQARARTVNTVWLFGLVPAGGLAFLGVYGLANAADKGTLDEVNYSLPGSPNNFALGMSAIGAGIAWGALGLGAWELNANLNVEEVKGPPGSP